jgi:hypothetical protein
MNYPAGKHPNSMANLKPIQPGESRNPNGRPKGTSITHKMREIVEKDDGAVADALVRAAVKAAMKGDFRFWQEILNRVDGKVADRIAGHDGGELIARYVIDKGDSAEN